MKQIGFIVLILYSSFLCADNVVYETGWISSKETGYQLKEMDGNRLFPCKIVGRVEGIQIRYKSSYCPFIQKMEYFYSHWGMSDKWYSAYTRKYTEMGFKEYSHTTFVDLGGSVVHQATWILSDELIYRDM